MQRKKKRLLFPSPSSLSGAEREAKVSDFECLTQKSIGEGAFGEVYKVRHKVTKKQYAIKVVNKEKVISSNLLNQLVREIRIMYSLKHPHIVKLYNHFEDEDNFYLVLELAEGGTLWQRLARYKSFDEPTSAQYLREVILAVQYLHARDPPVIHRDIKPENLLLDKTGRDGSIKLADFGWSNFFNSDRTRNTYCGTLDYLAPEMITQSGHTTSLDLWNLGVLLFEFLTGTAPFQANTQTAVFEKILKVKIAFPKNFPPLAKDLIYKLLKVNPEERLSLEEIVDHPWLQTQAPLRPTIVQHLTKEPLPCTFDPEELCEIKPFEKHEYKVLNSQNPPACKSSLETELKQTREENVKYKTQLEQKETQLQVVKDKITELKSNLNKLEGDCSAKKKLEDEIKLQLSERNKKVQEIESIQKNEVELYHEYEDLKTKNLQKRTELSLLETEIENYQKLSTEKQKQISSLEHQINKVKYEIDNSKHKHSKINSEMTEEFKSLESEIQNLRDHQDKSLVPLVEFSAENVELLKARSQTENRMLEQYEEANQNLIELENRYTQLKLKYDNEVSNMKKQELSLEGTESLQIDPEQLQSLKQRLAECLEFPYKNKAVYEELNQLQKILLAYENPVHNRLVRLNHKIRNKKKANN